MILKGNSRAGAVDLALHLSNEIDNEEVIVHSVRGSASSNLYDTFREWDVICSQTKATKPFYSLSINPDPTQRDWTDIEWDRAIEAVETKLGLSGQPRAVVFHHKVGESDGQVRKHVHVVWSRIDARTLKAVHMGNDRYKLKACAKDLAQKFGLELRYGKRGKDKTYDHTLSHGQNRDPETAKQRKDKITKLWNQHAEPKALNAAMRQAGYVIAKGDRRSFVVVDLDGQVHSLARQIRGARAKPVKERLGDASSYPDVNTAKDEQAIRRKAETDKLYTSVNQRPKVELTVEQKLFAKLRRMARRTDELAKRRRKELDKTRQETIARQVEEKRCMIQKHRQRETKRWLKHYRSKPTGLIRGLRVIFGYELALKWKQAREEQHRQTMHQKRLERLADIQAFERDRIEQQRSIIARKEKREAQSIAKLAKKLGVSTNIDVEKDLRVLRRSIGQKSQDPQDRGLSLV
ncbi:MAG: hypothetical protein AAF950_08180 [Pseudomonadota bacterium]